MDVTVSSAAGTTITLTVSVGSPVNGRTPVTRTWTGATTATVELNRGSRTKTLNNTGQFVDVAPAGTHLYKICEPGGSVCSNEVTVEL